MVHGTAWQRASLGRFLANRQQSWVMGARLRQWKDKGRNLFFASERTDVISTALWILHHLQSLAAVGSSSWCCFNSCSVYLSSGLGTGAEPITQKVHRVERRMISHEIKACLCHYILKMWYCFYQGSDSQTKGLLEPITKHPLHSAWPWTHERDKKPFQNIWKSSIWILFSDPTVFRWI